MNRVLNLVHRDPLASDDLTTCLRLCAPGDAVLLRGAAVTAALEGADCDRPEGVRWYVLADDLALYGLGLRALRADVAPIDYPGFVQRVLECELCQSW